MGIDTIEVGFPLLDVDLDSSRIRWAMYSTGRKIDKDTRYLCEEDGSSQELPLHEVLAYDKQDRTDPRLLDKLRALASPFSFWPGDDYGLPRGDQDDVAFYVGTLQPRPGVTVTITVHDAQHNAHLGPWAKVQVNAARLYDPAGWGLCPPELASAYVVALLAWLAGKGLLIRLCEHSEAAELAGDPDALVCTLPECLSDELCGVRLGRVDLAVDFLGVRDQRLWRDVLLAQAARRRWQRRGWDSGAMVSTGSRGVLIRLYDKQREAQMRRRGVHVPAGTMRVEVQLRRDKLRREGLRYIEDLTGSHARRLFARQFERAGLDRAVGGRSPVPQRSLAGTSPHITRQLYDLLDAAAHGSGWAPDVSAPTALDYWRLAERHGFVVGRDRRERHGPQRHLDTAAGMERAPSLDWQGSHKSWPWRLSQLRMSGKAASVHR